MFSLDTRRSRVHRIVDEPPNTTGDRLMGEVVEIVTSNAVTAAWDAFQEHAARSFDDRRLILDRGYMETWAKLEARFKRLSVMPRAY